MNTSFDLAALMLRWLHAWAAELLTVALVVLTVSLTGLVIGSDEAQGLLVCGLAVLLLAPRTRECLAMLLGRRARRRRWGEALGGVVAKNSAPYLLAYKEDNQGSWAQVRTGPGGTVTELENRSEALAAWLGAYDVRFERHPNHAGQAWLRALHRDPLDSDPGAWPWLGKVWTDLWKPVPVGLDENGNEVTISLPGHNLLIGGEPGAGKSVALAQLVAAAALDPRAKLWLLDGKVVELAAWAPVATASAGVEISEAIDILATVQAEMEARYKELLHDRLRKVLPGTGLHLVVVDELAHYSTWAERKARDRFCDLLRDLVSRGRAAGVVVIAATQKPGSEIVPTSLRDLFGYRWALRCTTPAASDTILGAGWASLNITSHTIAAHQRGVGWLHHEASRPVRLRSHHLTDGDIEVLATRAEALREGIRP